MIGSVPFLYLELTIIQYMIIYSYERVNIIAVRQTMRDIKQKEQIRQKEQVET